MASQIAINPLIVRGRKLVNGSPFRHRLNFSYYYSFYSCATDSLSSTTITIRNQQSNSCASGNNNTAFVPTVSSNSSSSTTCANIRQQCHNSTSNYHHQQHRQFWNLVNTNNNMNNDVEQEVVSATTSASTHSALSSPSSSSIIIDISPSSASSSSGQTNQRQHCMPNISSKRIVMKQQDKDLSSKEIDLKNAIQQHETLILKINNNNNNNNNDKDIDDNNTEIQKSLRNIRNCLEELEYWEDSLIIEQEIELYCNTAIEITHCIFRQGKLFMRTNNDIVNANIKYTKALEMFQIEYNNNSNNCTDKHDDNNNEVYHTDIGKVYMAMAGIHFARENIDECLRLLDISETHFRKHDNTKEKSLLTSEPAQQQRQQKPNYNIDLVKCLDNQGRMYRIKEDFHVALLKYEEALQIVGEKHDFSNNDDDFEKRQTLQMHIGDVLGAMDDYDAAIYYYEKILKEDKARRKKITNNNDHHHDDNKVDETALDGVISHCIGVMHTQKRELGPAEEKLSEALELKKRFGGETNIEVGRTLIALGAVHGVAGNKRQAYDCFHEALIIERMHTDDENDPQILHILRNIAILNGEKVPKWEE